VESPFCAASTIQMFLFFFFVTQFSWIPAVYRDVEFSVGFIYQRNDRTIQDIH